MIKSADSGQTIIINEMQMYCEIIGQGDPLVLLHSFSRTSADWRLIFNYPLNRYRLIIPDLRGHGRSTNPSMVFTHRQSAFDIFALLDQLGIEKFKAIGVRCGANILLHMATQQPARVEAMMLLSAAHYYPEQTRTIMRQLSLKSRTEEEWRSMREMHRHGDDQIRALWTQGSGFKDSYDDMNFTPSCLSKITARTLIAHSDRDPLYPINLPVELHAAIPKSNLWIIPDVGRGPVFGVMPDQFANTAMAFLGG